MNSIAPVSSVFFRMPGSDRVEYFLEGLGDDQFVIAPFLKNETKIILSGNIEFVGDTEILKILNTWEAFTSFDIVSTSKEEYTALVNEALKEIDNNAFKKVVLAGRSWLNTNCGLFELFQHLLEGNTNAFVYAFYHHGTIMIGATPETLLASDTVQLMTEALGGTKTRGVFTEKEMIEHQQISSYICGILDENKYRYTMSQTEYKLAGNLEHLCSNFYIVPKSLSFDLELADKLHPTSAVCGLPFDPSLKFIVKKEAYNRNFYSGYLGPVRHNGEFNYFVNLRCAEWYKNGLMLYAGAGINSMSVPKDEWNEIKNKMETIAQWLK